MRNKNTKSPSTLQYYLADEGCHITHKEAQFIIAAAHRISRVRKDMKLLQKLIEGRGIRGFSTENKKFPIVIQLQIRDVLLDVNDRIPAHERKREISVRQRRRTK